MVKATIIAASVGAAIRFDPVDAVVFLRMFKFLLRPTLVGKHSVSLAAAIGDLRLRPEIFVP